MVIDIIVYINLFIVSSLSARSFTGTFLALCTRNDYYYYLLTHAASQTRDRRRVVISTRWAKCFPFVLWRVYARREIYNRVVSAAYNDRYTRVALDEQDELAKKKTTPWHSIFERPVTTIIMIITIIVIIIIIIIIVRGYLVSSWARSHNMESFFLIT